MSTIRNTPPTVTASIHYGRVPEENENDCVEIEAAKGEISKQGKTYLTAVIPDLVRNKRHGEELENADDFGHDVDIAAIDSGLLPLSYPYNEAVEKAPFDRDPHQSRSFTNVDYNRDAAVSMFYNGDHGEALRVIRDVLTNEENSKIEGMHLRLVGLECEFFRIQNDKCKTPHANPEYEISRLDEMIKCSENISYYDLLRLAYTLQGTRRHYGAFFVCRAAALKIPIDCEAKFRKWYFELAYLLFVEMALQAFTVIEKGSPVNRLVFRSMKRVVDKMRNMWETLEESDKMRNMWETLEESDKEVGVVMLGTCYNCLAYCCNVVSFYKGAKRCAEYGETFVREGYKAEGTDAKKARAAVLGDLLLSKAIALHRESDYIGCKESAKRALGLIGDGDHSEEGRNRRSDLIIDKLLTAHP